MTVTPQSLPLVHADSHVCDAAAAAQMERIVADLGCVYREHNDAFREVVRAHHETLLRLARAAELRDGDTGVHILRIGYLAEALATFLGEPAAFAQMLRRAAPMHDVGKIGVPDGVLKKPGSYTAEDRLVMNQHPIIGAEILGRSRLPLFQLAAEVAMTHHERWDGTGYPDRLSGEQIPLLARIVAVCDAFDAITSDRPYHENQKGKPPEYGFAEIARQKGRQFDPQCATAFLEIRDDILRVMCDLIPGLSARLNNDTGPATCIGGNGPSVDATPPPLHSGDSMSEINVLN